MTNSEVGSGRRGDEDGLGKGAPKFEKEGGNGDHGANNGWIDGGTKCKIGDASRAGGGISGDRTRDGGTCMVAKADGGEVVDKKESGPNGEVATAGFNCSVVGATGNVAQSSDEFSGTEFSRTEKERVFQKQIGQKVETLGFEVRSSLNGRGRGHKQIDCICGADESQSNEGIR